LKGQCDKRRGPQQYQAKEFNNHPIRQEFNNEFQDNLEMVLLEFPELCYLKYALVVIGLFPDFKKTC
jgi:hypothetical protein